MDYYTTPSFYLQPEHWSPRYDESFFTVKVDTHARLTVPADPLPMHPDLRKMATSRFHPACYYQVKVMYGRQVKVMWRRFAQFRWLYEQVLIRYPLASAMTVLADWEREQPVIPFPGKTWIWEWPHSEEFEEARNVGLDSFLRDLLSRPGYATHPAVVDFLELDLDGSGIPYNVRMSTDDPTQYSQVKSGSSTLSSAKQISSPGMNEIRMRSSSLQSPSLSSFQKVRKGTNNNCLVSSNPDLRKISREKTYEDGLSFSDHVLTADSFNL